MRRHPPTAGDRALEGYRGGSDVPGRDAAAAADDLCTFPTPLEREGRKRIRVDALVEAPEVAGEMAEVRVDAQWEVGEITEPADHAGHVVDGEAVDEKGADAHLLEPARSPPEQVAFRRSPVLAVDAADAVAAAAERDPDGDPQLEQLLDEGERLGLTNERERFEQDQVGMLVIEDLRQQLCRAAPRERLGILREGECDRAWPRYLRGRSTSEPDPGARDIHPVQQAGSTRSSSLRLCEYGPRVCRDDVAARSDVRAVDIENRLGSAVQRPAAPEIVSWPSARGG